MLLLTVSLCEGARKKKAESLPSSDVEATVISLRRYELGTYVEVMRDDGLHEWIEINREEGLEVKANQRIAYSTRSRAHESTAFGMLRSSVDFRILPLQRDEQIYSETSPNGTPIFTDNPSVIHPEDISATKRPKVSMQPGIDEVIVVDQEELGRKEAMTEEYYRYLEQTNTDKPMRRAKRAKQQ